MASGPKKRKPYTHLACQTCKDKHLKCDGSKPSCSNCQSKRLECYYRDERNRRRDSSQTQMQQKLEEELREKINFLIQERERWKRKYTRLRDLANSLNFPEHASIFHQMSPNLHPLSPSSTIQELELSQPGHEPQYPIHRDQVTDMINRRRSPTTIPGVPDFYQEISLRYGGEPRIMEGVPIINPPTTPDISQRGFMYDQRFLDFIQNENFSQQNQSKHFDTTQLPLYQRSPGIPLPTSPTIPITNIVHTPRAMSINNIPYPFPIEIKDGIPGNAPPTFDNHFTTSTTSNHDSKPTPMSSYDTQVFSSLDSKPADIYTSEGDNEPSQQYQPPEAVVFAPHDYSINMIGGPAPMGRGDDDEGRGNGDQGRYQVSSV